MKTFNLRALWLVIPLILLVQIIAGLSARAQAADWPHERVPRITPRAQAARNSSQPVNAPAAAVPPGAEPAVGVIGPTAQSPVDLPADLSPVVDRGPDAPSGPVPPTPVTITNGAARVPILVYHHISDEYPGTRYYTSIQQFEAQMQLLNDQGYTPITMVALIDILEGRAPLPERPIVLTFDDGNEDVYLNAFPIMQSYGFPGVVFMVVQRMDGQDYFQADQLREMLGAGWEVGSHTMSHADLSQSGIDVGYELKQSLEDLQAELGAPIKSFAYPYAVTSQSIFQAVEAAGYSSAVCSGWVNTQRLSSRYCLSRREVMPEMDIQAFQRLIEEP